MTNFFLNHLRRLPVFFVLDCSMAMVGTFQVTMQEGLLLITHKLSLDPVASQCVYLSWTTFGEKATLHRLVHLDSFSPPTLDVQNACALKPALTLLTEALTFDLIVTRPDRPGDYTPIVFLILGSRPSDLWQEHLKSLASFTDNRRPMIIILVTQPELVQEVGGIGNHVLLLHPAEAASMTNFFFWVAQTIIKVCQNSLQGATSIDFPVLPYGVVVPH